MAGAWTFLSNYGHVVVALARDPDARIRDIADGVGITERAVQKILHELVEQGYVVAHRRGRRNSYEVVRDTHLRHPLEAQVRIGELTDLVVPGQVGRDGRHHG